MTSQGTWGGICGQGLSPEAGLPPKTHPLGGGQQKARGWGRDVPPPEVISCTEGRVKGRVSALCTKANKTPPFFGGWQGVNLSRSPCR